MRLEFPRRTSPRAMNELNWDVRVDQSSKVRYRTGGFSFQSGMMVCISEGSQMKVVFRVKNARNPRRLWAQSLGIGAFLSVRWL